MSGPAVSGPLRPGAVRTEAQAPSDGRRAAGGWSACPSCGWLLYGKRLERNLRVCPECTHHFRLGARDRIAQLADRDSFAEFDGSTVEEDPLGFTDLRPYVDRLADARAAAGERDAVVIGAATLAGHPVTLAVMEFGFMGGSMGSAVGELVTRAAETALARRTPLIVVCASGGARMQEGVVSLLQMAKTSQAMARLHEAGVFSVCVLTDPTYGGVSASFAMLGSVVLAESGAHIGFAGPRVIAQTIRQDLPEDFQTAEFLFAHGLLDRVVPRSELRGLLARLLAMHAPHDVDGTDAVPEPAAAEIPYPAASADPWDVVRTARVADRPTARDYLRYSFDDFVELHGDRATGDDPAIVGGLAVVDGRTVVVIGHQKGHATGELVAANFGMPHPEGYRKAMRLMDYAQRFGFPVVTIVDTPGAYPGVSAEERGQSTAIAEIIMRSSRLRVPVVSLVTGEGGSGGALALCTSDRLLMLEHGFLSVISPEGCASILWRTAEAAPDAARALRLGARYLWELGIVDTVVPEPPGGVQACPPAAGRSVRAAIGAALREVTRQDVDTLLATRYRRFRRVGADLDLDRLDPTLGVKAVIG
jgi:acetyl-CoA carboxylase carboxyl transferase beta subunit/acetyl-CoA carboxylase carboxyl transferase alpha subunit